MTRRRGRAARRDHALEASRICPDQHVACVVALEVAREHVTAGIFSMPHLFVLRSVTDSSDNSDLRLTVDTKADLALIRALHDAIDISGAALYSQILSCVRAHPELQTLNAGEVTWEPVKPKTW